jgi:NitT/TauT family transport system permease protein
LLAFRNALLALISELFLIGLGQGLGRSLAYSGEIADMAGVMMNILVIAILATLIDQVVLEKFKQRMLRYQYV